MVRAPSVKVIDPLPEADCVEGFLHPRETAQLVGHSEGQQELADAFAGGSIHHGWLLAGPQGIGKATLAYAFARFVLARDGERDTSNGVLGVDRACTTSRLVRAQSHPGLLIIRRQYDVKTKRFGASISVDAVRKLRGFLTHSESDGAWRVVIVDTADDLNLNAANAILKSLEEPPVRTIFLLLTSAPGRLLPTIRSRCRVLHLSGLEPDALKAAALRAFEGAGMAVPGEGDWPRLLTLGQGRVGRVLRLHGAGGLEIYSGVERLVTQAAAPDWKAVHALGDKLAPVAARENFELFFELFLDLVARLLKAKVVGEGTREDVEMASKLVSEDKLAEWAAFWEAISSEKAEVAALNLDRKAFFIEKAARLQALASG